MSQSPTATACTAGSFATGREQGGIQATFAELSPQLRDVTFVVVDLETTGGCATNSRITEIGAVKVCGGQVCGEFSSLVNAGVDVPPYIVALTGITTAMVRAAPPIAAVLPAFLEFAGGAVLVAHNARFDISFLKAECVRLGYAWPSPIVLDTLMLARQALDRQVPNLKLETLARYFSASVTPNHRALDDARATVAVLHGVFERLAAFGITHLEDAISLRGHVPAAVRAKRHLAADLPTCAGVYLFESSDQEVLYVGVSTNIRKRVKSYFTASEKRSRMAEMVTLAHHIRAIACPTVIEAQVRELRLIAQHNPRYNRRSRFPERWPWLKLTSEAFGRIAIVRTVRDDNATYLGPFPSMQAARGAAEVVNSALGLRTCTKTLPATPAKNASACILGQVGACLAPCISSQVSEPYQALIAQARTALVADPNTIITANARKIASLTKAERFEDAASLRDQVESFLQAAKRSCATNSLLAAGKIVAGHRTPGGWELLAQDAGKLTGTAFVPLGSDPLPVAQALAATCEEVNAPIAPMSAAHPQETALILKWLNQEDVRLIFCDQGWSEPIRDASRAPSDMLQRAVAAALPYELAS